MGTILQYYVDHNGYYVTMLCVECSHLFFANDFSRTPLHWATVCEKPDVLRALMAAGGTQYYICPST